MNTGAHNLNKILQNPIQPHTKSVPYPDQVEFILYIEGWIDVQVSTRVTHHINRIRKKTGPP